MSANDEFLKKRQKEIIDGATSKTQKDLVSVNPKIMEMILETMQRQNQTVAALHDELKRLKTSGGQTTL